MSERIEKYGLNIDAKLVNFIESEAIPGTGVDVQKFWQGFAEIIEKLGPINKSLLEKREDIQSKIDQWHITHRGQEVDVEKYKSFLLDIDYLVPEGEDFKIDTSNVDLEIAKLCGPQLVVPIMNARYALNAANARWGSLYDAFYGTDAMGDLPPEGSYSNERGDKVISNAKAHLDKVVPLNLCKWHEISKISILEGQLLLSANGQEVALINKNQFVGHIQNNNSLNEIIFVQNGLHVRIIINPDHVIGKIDRANISDIILEAALTTIMDCEDSVAAVDGEDKVLAYKNWLGLMKGDLTEDIEKAGKNITRRLNSDIEYINTEGTKAILKGRSLMLNRNVGHLMTNPSVLDSSGNEVGEGLIDAMCTIMIAMHDLSKSSGIRNSLKGSVYIVKPKMHGPEEVAFTDEIFSSVENILGLPSNTVKIGIMDEERRTSTNLKECIRSAKSRVAFINTGFLDRTGDEIHTSMEAGPFLRKGDMKSTEWIKSYEERNVDIGLNCGLQGRAQIGKGMWAMPDLMKDMLEQKIGHPKAGANCAWVPSPTAATLHAMHYHMVDVFDVQNEIIEGGSRGTLDELLKIPVADGHNWSQEDIEQEIENNAQGILGYVVRWVDQGVGCSKVPDIHDIGLMEDRATCRISSQALSNWLHHKIVSEEQVMVSMKKMAAVVDDQNKNDGNYISMSPTFDTIAFKAACDLVFKGRVQPSGYTEPVLHSRRIELKNKDSIN
ncbi:MAG: malate synthase G [Alphaproteobacteria bacterium]|tara:strand:+ start:1433 stop:3601 length:2169 start_codon:yes stop_codon:yes gene_type:complete